MTEDELKELLLGSNMTTAEELEKAVEEQRVKEEKRNAVDGLRRRFHNLDLEE